MHPFDVTVHISFTKATKYVIMSFILRGNLSKKREFYNVFCNENVMNSWNVDDIFSLNLLILVNWLYF